jgi:hypothetical protein
MPAKVTAQDDPTTNAAVAAAVAEQLKKLGLIPGAPSPPGQDQLGASQTKTDERMRRRKAREYLERKLGRPVSDNTMIYTWRIPYFRDGRDSIYLKSTLDRFVAERIAAVSQHMFGNATEQAGTTSR